MSDTRLTLLGVALIFAGFVTLGIFGQHHYDLAIQAQELGACFEYEDDVPVEVDCDAALQDRTFFFALVIGIIAAGIFFLVRGVRGKWDQDVKPQDKIGPDTSFPG